MRKRWIAAIIVCALLMSPAIRVLADEKTEAEETRVEESTEVELADAEEFIADLRTALDARMNTADSEDEMNAPFKAEAEIIEKYSSATFEDPGLDSAVKLYYAALSGIIAAEEFAEKESYYAILDSTYRQQYAVALLILNEEYGLELDENEISVCKEILDSASRGETGVKANESVYDYSGWQRVTVGHYSYAIPEEYSLDETANNSETDVTFVSSDRSREISIMAEDMEEELGEYAATMGPMFLDMFFMAAQEEYQDGEIELLDADFAGFKAKRLTGIVDVEGEKAYVDAIFSINDKDMVVLAYTSKEIADTDKCKTEFEQILASMAEPEEQAAEEESETNSNTRLFGKTIYLQEDSSGSYSITDKSADKILVWEGEYDSYYDKDTDCYIWYNTEVDPPVWQYWYEGISSDFGDYGWMEYEESTGKWWIEKDYGNWIELPEKYDSSSLWHIDE